MFKKESVWIINNLKNLKQEDKVVDIGCSTKEYRKIQQPYINKIYKYLDSKNIKLVKIDFDKNTDAHIHLDITKKLPDNLVENFDCVLATNLLEHIETSKLDMVIKNLNRLLKKNGKLIVSVPYNLPLHNRPIDSGLRPDCNKLTKLLSESFAKISCETWTDEHYREPYISNPTLAELPKVTGGIFIKRL